MPSEARTVAYLHDILENSWAFGPLVGSNPPVGQVLVVLVERPCRQIEGAGDVGQHASLGASQQAHRLGGEQDLSEEEGHGAPDQRIDQPVGSHLLITGDDGQDRGGCGLRQDQRCAHDRSRYRHSGQGRQEQRSGGGAEDAESELAGEDPDDLPCRSRSVLPPRSPGGALRATTAAIGAKNG